MAVTLAKGQGAVTLWGQDKVSVSDMVKTRRNDRTSGVLIFGNSADNNLRKR